MKLRSIRNRTAAWATALSATLAILSAPALAQVETIDPNSGIDADLIPVEQQQVTHTQAAAQPTPPETAPDTASSSQAQVAPDWSDPVVEAEVAAASQGGETEDIETYGEDDLIGAAGGVFGKGSEGVARMIESILKDQGRPNGYIVGREAGGAFIAGVRYGSGTLYHKVEGQLPVYWTGPSIGFDVGANAANTFVLVYNLHDTDEIYERYPAGEGQAYLVGGLHASYLRKGDIALIPIRMGAGLRLGVNAGYMKFSKKQRWLPF